MNGIRFGREVRWLFQTALLMFLVTISLGMARGIGLIDFESRNQIADAPAFRHDRLDHAGDPGSSSVAVRRAGAASLRR